ncbi:MULTISPECIES: helix-turn-helix transcriptional regulator [unclassified Streptomyces]|uniref:telomere-associated protein Tap n=1 Tax=Streptomyces sp. 135 TaxID=2838850 RepID=UPI001CBAD2C0|nr:MULTISPECIES: helix-turn-helix transcriptional regulator [unclassified Streptomyces]WPO75639.1 helix-turn-helix transcriptional regulator [Streptomyces sp. KN37]
MTIGWLVEVTSVSTENDLFGAVDALLEQVAQDELPPPAERKRLREAAGLSQAQVAQALDARREAVGNWESGRTEPRPPKRAAYARLLEGLAARFPAPAADEPAAAPAPPEPLPAPSVVPASRPAAASDTTGPTVVPRRAPAKKGAKSAAKKAGAAAVDPRFENGPLAVIDCDQDGHVSAYCVGGLVLDVPAKSIPALVEWTLKEARLGQPRLHRNGKDADPVLVLMPSALERYGLPAALSEEERRAGRLPAGHAVLKQLERAEWQLTQRGFGPWARIFRPAEGAKRNCVQLCVPAWNALDVREWDDREAPLLPTMSAADLARFLGTYATRVMTPRGTTAVTGLELMVALHPPTRAVRDERTGEWHSAPAPGALTAVYEPVECEVPDGHPVLKGKFPRHHQRTPAEMLMEESYDWCRPLTDAECMQPYVVGIDVNMAFAAAANRLTVGLGGPTHVRRPVFDPKLPGSWLVDLSHIALDERLPSPFTARGERPEGPAWYATPTVAYAVELGFEVRPVEAYVRHEHGGYLDAWYQRLRDAYMETMADLGVVSGMEEHAFLEAMAASKSVDPEMALVLKAIKATAKGGIGKLRERPRGTPMFEPWPALERKEWRPDIRAAVLATTRVNMHRKMMKVAAAADIYPVAIGTDCVVYPSPGPSPLDFLPRTPDGKPVPGGFRLGVSPGMVKHEGTQTTLWAEEQYEKHGLVNIARIIKDGGRTADDGE